MKIGEKFNNSEKKRLERAKNSPDAMDAPN
jgi:hypothetical protein